MQKLWREWVDHTRVLNTRARSLTAILVGHTVVRCRQPSKDEKPQDETAFSPGSPMREEPDLLGPEASEDPFEFKRHDDNNDLW